MADFNPAHEKILHEMMEDIPGTKLSKMFGYPAYKVNGKLAVGLYKEGILAKVGPERARVLIGQQGITFFEPMEGRAWKDWILLTDHFDQYQSIFEEAAQYVRDETDIIGSSDRLA